MYHIYKMSNSQHQELTLFKVILRSRLWLMTNLLKLNHVWCIVFIGKGAHVNCNDHQSNYLSDASRDIFYGNCVRNIRDMKNEL
jgi:hypothetical protein